MTSWGDCRFLTCSVLPVRMACQCECPFCFSRSSISALASEPSPWPAEDLARHFSWAAARGATRMVVTGGGEPLLRADACVEAIRVAKKTFDEIALFTNGALLSVGLARRLREAGLSYVCWSRHAVSDASNRSLMGVAAPAADDVLAACAAADLKVRATCVMNAAGVADRPAVWSYIDAFAARGVVEFTFKHTYVARASSLFASSPANQWATDHQVSADPFAGHGEVVASLPWGPTIRRIGEVQVCHYYEPTPDWELAHRLARSSNLLSDGRLYASLEDETSLLHRLGSGMTPRSNPRSTPVSLRRPSALAT